MRKVLSGKCLSLFKGEAKITPFKITLLVSLFLVLFLNFSFWNAIFQIFRASSGYGAIFLISVFFFVLLYLNVLLTFFSFRYILKPVFIILVVGASIAAYFMDAYGIYIDNSMIQNTLGTDGPEALEYLHIKMIFWIALLGILPSFLIYKVQIQYKSFGKEVLQKVGIVVASLILLVTIMYPFYQEYASLLRNNRQLRHLINPVNYVNAIRHQLKSSIKLANVAIKPIGLDAKIVRVNSKRTIAVLVVGETARADHFSLFGYQRNTNPFMSLENIISYKNAYSCGTTTAVSLPCIFSRSGRKQFKNSDVIKYEGLLDVVSRSGVEVLFRDNNTGCKGVCTRVKTENMMSMEVPGLCKSGECYDEILLHELEKHITSTKKDLLIVLHQNGSHGPSYYQRYPKQFSKFKPECNTNQLQDCSRKNITNAYDNTILYTDYFLSKVITLLKSHKNTSDTAMIYVSDHGESLGEKGIYLHGLPYFIAPDEQKHVPLLMWMSNSYKISNGINYQCLKDDSNSLVSHDYIFHSILGLLDIRSKVYKADLDLLAKCKARTVGIVGLKQ